MLFRVLTQQRTESMPEERIYVLFLMFRGILEPRRQSNGRRREDTVHKQQRHIQAINRGKFGHIRAHSGTFGKFVHVETRKKRRESGTFTATEDS